MPGFFAGKSRKDFFLKKSLRKTENLFDEYRMVKMDGSVAHSALTGGHFRLKMFCCFSFRNVEICLIKTIRGTNDHQC